MRRVLLCLLLVVATGAAQTKQLVMTDVVVKDGDTFSGTACELSITVRMAGIDAPEKAQAWGPQARAYTDSLLRGRTVVVHYSKKDGYGRLVGWVYVDSVEVNSLLVGHGLAWVYTQYPIPSDRKPALLALEALAREQRRGLWVDGKAVEPWIFRSKK